METTSVKKGKKIFISYGNEIYYDSLQRIKKMAEDTGIFDQIIIYTDKDLPDEIKSHTLMQYARGGGYWFWKPFVILQTLKEVATENDIVIYSDSGNEIFKHKDWLHYFQMLNKYDGVCFKYGKLAKEYTKKELLDYFSDECRNLSERYQIMGGLNLWTKQSIPIVQEWFDTMKEHPELVLEDTSEPSKKQNKHLKEHRHDQAVLTGIVYKNENKIAVLWEKCESFDQWGQAVFCARIANTPDRIKGRPHKPRRLTWRINRLKKILFRNIREFIYKHIL